MPLHRLTDSVLINKNGSKACPTGVAWSPRPQTPFVHQCDEYPFRSTKEGAYTGGGRARTFDWCQVTLRPVVEGPSGTGSSTGGFGPGYSICMIDQEQSVAAGNMLGTFYLDNRIIDNDEFYVRTAD